MPVFPSTFLGLRLLELLRTSSRLLLEHTSLFFDFFFFFFFFLSFFFFFFFFLSLELSEDSLDFRLLDLLLSSDSDFCSAACGGGASPRPPGTSSSLEAVAMAREPACGDHALRLGWLGTARPGKPAGRIMAADSGKPGRSCSAGCGKPGRTKPAPGKDWAAMCWFGFTGGGGMPTPAGAGRRFRAWGLPSGARKSSKLMVVPARSEVLYSAATVSFANQMSCEMSGWIMNPKPLTAL